MSESDGPSLIMALIEPQLHHSPTAIKIRCMYTSMIQVGIYSCISRPINRITSLPHVTSSDCLGQNKTRNRNTLPKQRFTTQMKLLDSALPYLLSEE